MKRVLLTGATGLVGRALCDELARHGYRVRAALRSAGRIPASVSETVLVGDITRACEWADSLGDVDAVIHLAARAHVLDETGVDNPAYAETNARATHRLAEVAAATGVRRLVFLSSVKVNGEETAQSAFTALDEPAPKDEYARSKLLGERYVRAIGKKSGLEVVIVRPPLVYGPGVRANFLRLLRWVDLERPLPLGAIDNARSLVSVWNLASLLVRTLEHPGAAGRIWLVSDGRDLSTPELIRSLGRALQRRVRLFPVPVSLLRLAGRMVGRAAEVSRLCGSLKVDISATRRELDWSPVLSVEDGLARTADWYRDQGH
jgi:nucleoside-diphosphate-sugar epimerase